MKTFALKNMCMSCSVYIHIRFLFQNVGFEGVRPAKFLNRASQKRTPAVHYSEIFDGAVGVCEGYPKPFSIERS